MFAIWKFNLIHLMFQLFPLHFPQILLKFEGDNKVQHSIKTSLNMPRQFLHLCDPCCTQYNHSSDYPDALKQPHSYYLQKAKRHKTYPYVVEVILFTSCSNQNVHFSHNILNEDNSESIHTTHASDDQTTALLM